MIFNDAGIASIAFAILTATPFHFLISFVTLSKILLSIKFSLAKRTPARLALEAPGI
jgi:uncharacterized membrane protein